MNGLSYTGVRSGIRTLMTTRSKAMEEQLASILAMLEEQRQRQEMLMERSDELAEEQRKESDHFAELDKLRENVRGLAETLEERARSPIRVVGPTDGVKKPLVPADGAVETPVTVKTESVGERAAIHGTGLRPDADEFVPVGGGDPRGGRRGADRSSLDADPAVAGAAAGLRTIRPTPYDGRTSWDAYKTQFDMLSELNGWSDAEKATYLAINLKGSVLTVLSNLPEPQRRDYPSLTAALDTRFGVAHQTELNRVQLRNQRRRREGLPELAEDVERLTRLAYPGADTAMVETLARDQFIDALPSQDMQLHLRQLCPTSIRQALQHALELESFILAGNESGRPVRATNLETPSTPTKNRQTEQGDQLLRSMQECLVAIQECAKQREKGRNKGKSVLKKQPKDASAIVCYFCQQKGHIRRNCPERRKGKTGASQNQGNDQ